MPLFLCYPGFYRSADSSSSCSFDPNWACLHRVVEDSKLLPAQRTICLIKLCMSFCAQLRVILHSCHHLIVIRTVLCSWLDVYLYHQKNRCRTSRHNRIISSRVVRILPAPRRLYFSLQSFTVKVLVFSVLFAGAAEEFSKEGFKSPCFVVGGWEATILFEENVVWSCDYEWFLCSVAERLLLKGSRYRKVWGGLSFIWTKVAYSHEQWRSIGVHGLHRPKRSFDFIRYSLWGRDLMYRSTT